MKSHGGYLKNWLELLLKDRIKVLKLGVSIIICTYNGRQRLSATLDHLVRQEFNCDAEVILVDNASIDGTKAFADKWWEVHGTEKLEYRSFFQPIQGKSYAQELGYKKAVYEYLLICDDDNWLNPQYVQKGFDIMSSNNEIGALGGWCEAVFEEDKPEWFDFYSRYYAVGKQGVESGDISNKKGCLYGAGMVIRKSHRQYLNGLGFTPLLTCRKGNTLSSGGDTEYSYVLRLIGYKIWYDERLYFRHFMPEGRLNLDYVKRIRKAISESNFVLSTYTDRLSNRTVTRRTFYKDLKSKPKTKFKSNIKKKLFGSFEEKEQATEFFRGLYRLIFSYDKYRKHNRSIDKWLLNHIEKNK